MLAALALAVGESISPQCYGKHFVQISHGAHVRLGRDGTVYGNASVNPSTSTQ